MLLQNRRRRDQRRRDQVGDKHQAIIDAAIAVIARQGYHGAQISRIAEAAGVAGGTVYLYFRNKQDLLVSVFRERMGSQTRDFIRQLEEIGTPPGKLRRLVQEHFRVLAGDPAFAVVTQIELRQSDPEIRRGLSEVMKAYFKVIEGVIDEGQRRGMFRAELDPRLIRNLIFGTVDQTVTAWVLSGAKYDLVGLADPICDLIMGGIEARPEPTGQGRERDAKNF